MNIFLLLAAAYLFGSIPFSMIIPRFFGIHVMEQGSKNPGFTNVLRTSGLKIGAVCLLLDMMKGFLPAMIARQFGMTFLDSAFSMECLAGLFGVFGHCYSPFLKLRGGKGVAATGGLLFALNLWLVPILFSVLIAVIAITKYMSVGSMTAAVAFPFAVFFLYGDIKFAIIPAIFTVFILFQHRENIARLRSGTENRFTLKKRS